MSDDFTENEEVAWEDVGLRRIFLECLASSSSTSLLSSVPSTTSEVYVSTLVDYIRDNASGNYRNKALLDELQAAIQEVARDGQVNWTLFKKATRRWVRKVSRNRWLQDGNNNINEKEDCNDDLLERFEDERGNSEAVSTDSQELDSLTDRCQKPKNSCRFVTSDYVNLSNVSSYSSISETGQRCAMSTDTTPESTDDIEITSHNSCSDLAHIDLRLRVRRFDEENVLLREDLARAEELSAGFKRQFEHLRQKFDRANEKYRQLERENDDHKEILRETQKKEKDCRWMLQKVEKERALLGKKLEEAEEDHLQIASLTSKLETCKKEKLEYVKEAIVCRQNADEKHTECEMLREKLAQIIKTHNDLQETYDSTIRFLRAQNQELKNQIFDLQSKHSVGDLSDGICSTPPTSYLHLYPQSTPYSDNQSEHQDSLFTELKASGFSIADTENASRVRDLEEELCWYNEEIREAVKQIDNLLEQLSQHRRTPYVPDLPLNVSTTVKTADIYELLQKVSKLSNTVNEMIWKPKVKDACSQVCMDSTSYTEQRICSQYGIGNFEDSLQHACEIRKRETKKIGEANEGRQSGFFVEAFSMNSQLLGEYADEVEVASEAESYRETDVFSPSRNESMATSQEIQEHTIIDPIVDEIDRILQFTNEEQTAKLSSDCSPSKNPKFRSIYTCAGPASDERVPEVNYSLLTDSTLNSPKRLQTDLAVTYVISSGGDGPSVGMIEKNLLTNGDNTLDEKNSMVKIIPRENSDTSGLGSITESMLKPEDSENTKSNDISTLPDDSTVDKYPQVSESSENLSLLSFCSNSAEPPTPRILNTKLEELPNSNGDTYVVTPNKAARTVPRRKIPVFQRSFDVDTFHGVGEPGGSDTYRLTERSKNAREDKKQFDDNMELDLECMKSTPNTRSFLLNTYRTNTNDSDSSESPSPKKSVDDQCDSPSFAEIPVRAIRPILFASKLKLPSTNVVSFSSVGTNSMINSNGDLKSEAMSRETKFDDKSNADSSVNEAYLTYDVSKPNNYNTVFSENSQISEMIRPGDEVERGITYRRGSMTREPDFSSFSLLSPAENSSTIDDQPNAKVESPSTVVLSSDGESTSCDSSPKREPPVIPTSIPLRSTYQKPMPTERPLAGLVPSKSRGLLQGENLIEGGVCAGYKTLNASSIVGSYSSGGGSSGDAGIRVLVEKATVVPAVVLAMSSGEDSSDSECDPMAIHQGDENRRNTVDETRSLSPGVVLPFVSGAFLGSSTPALVDTLNDDSTNERGYGGQWKPVAQKRDKRERHTIRRSLSENGCGPSESSCQCTTGHLIPAELSKEETRPNAFPSLTDARLQESGIANLSSSDEIGGSLSEADLERKYTALSVGLVTDRVTLSRRMAISIRQRDQAEINLGSEVLKMHQDIQDLAPLCIDRESLERVERVRHQLEMITQCAHRVSCTAETLGAVHQEHRVSRAVFLADRYLLVLRSRCEKLASDFAETKRILMENNIVVEELNGEVGDDLPRIRYRGMPTNNRTMMARRRASIATIFRPLGNFQDVTKDGARQRNSVSGRVTLRRPSLTTETQKWEAEKLDRTDSSSSIGELREIFEQAESRRHSREENNNVLRLHSSNLSIRDCENEGDIWTNTREEPIAELLPIVDECHESRLEERISTQLWTTHTNLPWKPMLWCIIISFFLGFYMKHVVSSVNACSGTPLRWWSIEEILGRYIDLTKDVPRPI